MENNKRRIASLALFRNLYNEGRSDIMTILCEFVKNIVNTKHLAVFTPTQIKNELKAEYEFYIPEYVVESVIKKFCKKENSLYYPQEDRISNDVNNQKIEQIEQSHEIIVSKLVAYIEGKTQKELSIEEKEKLFQAFCKYIIEECDVEYSGYISSFILETQNNSELSILIQTIKEGVVLYTGLQYNDAVNEVGSWNEEFTIYVEQEILFHLAGYNGELYQQLYFDFRDLIREINRKAGKQLIKIRYFDSVKIEIEKFFNIAERIVDGKETLDYSNVAMTEIIRDCEHKSDVVAKRVAFFALLEENLIKEEVKNDEFSEYNINNEENITNLMQAFPTRDVEWSLRLLNYISQTRKGKITWFEKSKCILLTGNSTTMAVAFHPMIKENGEVPLATTLDYITNKLWFKMNKGFGSNTYPKSFSIVTKAQIVLSAQIVGSVSKEFEKIKKEFANKKKSEEIIIAELAELKTRVRKPEDIHEDEIDEILSTISVVDTERYLREREMERIAAEQQKEENQRLLSEMEKTKLKMTENESTANKIIQQKEEESNHYKACLAESNNKVIEQLNNQIIEIEKRKSKANTKINKRMRGVRWIPFTTIVIVILSVALCTYLYGWDKMEFVTWLISAIVVLIPYAGFAIGAKSFNPQDIINVKYKEYYTKKMYTQYDIDLDKLESLKKQKKVLEQNNIDL